MALPLLIPVAIVGAGALAGIGAFFSKDEIINNSYQTSIQKDYINIEKTFDFSNSYFENGSNFSLNSSDTVQTKKASKMEAELSGGQENIINTLVITGLLIGGGVFLLKK